MWVDMNLHTEMLGLNNADLKVVHYELHRNNLFSGKRRFEKVL